MCFELEEMGHTVERQKGIPMYYKEIQFDVGFRMDLLVDDLVIVEVKSVENILDDHHKQLLTYLKLANKKLGLLINFNTSNLGESIVNFVK